MVPIGWNVTKTIKNVFLDLSLNFITKRIFFRHKILKNAIFEPVDNFKQASQEKKYGRMLSWSLSKVSINFNQSTTVLLMTLLIMRIILTLNVSDIAYNGIKYNWFYL